MFHKLLKNSTGQHITHKKPFSQYKDPFKIQTIETVFDFAYGMTFGGEGEHRKNRSGGITERHNGAVFADAFQGKLAECATCNLLYSVDPGIKLDFSKSKRGRWDTVDVIVNNRNIAVKSTKRFGNLLLLETKDWNAEGQYIPNSGTGVSEYDFFLLVRISPSCEDIMKSHRWYFLDELDRHSLLRAIVSEKWVYDFVGYITREQLKYIIREKHIIFQGEKLNGTVPMDADNYYVQAGDMLSAEELLFEFQRENRTAKNEGIIETKNKHKMSWLRALFKKFCKKG